MKKTFRTLAAVVLAGALVAGLAALVSAGSDPKAAGGKDWTAMKAEFEKCHVCKNMAATMDQWGPVMKAELVQLDSGMAMIHTITDPAKVAVYHTAAAAVEKAGGECMTMTDEQVKTQLCPMCQEMVALAKAGAQISHGMTKTGDVLVITAKDPETVKKVHAYKSKCEMMTASM